MRAFPLCLDCAAEYADPADRRFHAQPIACPRCGPQLWLTRADGRPAHVAGAEAFDAARRLIARGHIVAVKGLGGFQLACDAANGDAVARLRAAKRREKKPFALMSRELAIVSRYCRVTVEDAACLQSPAAPIVIMEALPGTRVAPGVAPGVGTLGFMLPNSPLHHLLLRDYDRPIVLTSGNVSDEPQCIGNEEALTRLGGIADFFVLHDRDIARRVDDSVVRRMAGVARVLRRARGYAPAPLRLPRCFSAAPQVLAMGGELKNTFALLRDGEAVLSHHMGDLQSAPTFADYTRSIEAYLALFGHVPEAIAVDLHPEYLSTKLGTELAEQHGARLVEVQHHHAHVAACMAENGIPRDAGPVIGVVLDGLGYGTDGTIWGGEFLLADYRGFRRMARLRPVPMPGGTQAIREPWRNTYAHIVASMGWELFADEHGETPIAQFLRVKPRDLLDGMMARGVNAPMASSCGRLFDAVAAAVGLCRDLAQYEGQAAVELEALVDARAMAEEDEALAYEFDLHGPHAGVLLDIDPAPMWRALFADVSRGVAVPVIAARFHRGLAMAIAGAIAGRRSADAEMGAAKRVALSGGVFQNAVLLEQVIARLAAQGLDVLSHRDVPANDGGLALGQAAVAAARLLHG
jgi:hydrogenase maturation protein HypF